MDMQGYQNYKAQSINTMTQGELLMLLYDELIKRLLRSEIALKNNNFKVMEESVQRCIDIITYLDRTLDMQYQISNDLHRLYDYFIYQLNRVRFGRNKEVLESVKPQIIDIRDAFKGAQRSQNI